MRKFMAFFATFLITLVGYHPVQSNILANKVDPSPKFSKSVEIYLVDLSRSVEKDTVLEGLKSVRAKASNVYGDSRGSYDAPASAYFYWLPIRGVNDRKDFYPIFSPKIDSALWSEVRNSVGGRTNQIKALEKLRTEGLWQELIMRSNLSSCLSLVQKSLAAPGLFGNSLIKVSRGICNQAIQVRNSISNLQTGVSKYLSGEVSTNGGSDIFGAITRIDDEIQSKSGLGQYSKIKLIFVSDGVHNTPAIDLKNRLLSNTERACQFGAENASGITFRNNIVSVRMYGLGEGRASDSSKTELLRAPLRQFWECYWKKKGILSPEFGQLSELGIG